MGIGSRRLPLSRRATKTRRAGDLLLRPDQKSLKRKRHRRTESCTEVGHLIRFKWLASINTRRRIPPQLHADVLGKMTLHLDGVLPVKDILSA